MNEFRDIPSESEAPGFEVRRILVPTDFAPGAEQALDYAVQLAAAHGAAIRLVHVLSAYAPEMYGLEDLGDSGEALAERLEQRIEQLLEAASKIGTGQGVVMETLQRRSMATAPAILEEAEAFDADLIVTGSHGRHGLKRMLLGSVAEQVVRHASVPVLVVRGRLPEAAPRFHRFLAPTDFSPYADRGVRVAKAMARRFDAALDLLHVVEPIPFPASFSIGARSIYDYLPELRGRILKALTDLAEGDTTSAEAHVRHGHAAHAIVEFAAGRGTDLIVMATHGLSGWSRFLIGSVTERVVRTAPCPVLVVHIALPVSESVPAVPAEERKEVPS